MVTNEIKSERTVLQLLGIDKKWVRTEKGEWVDAKTLVQPTKIIENEIGDDKSDKKRWWKFWE